MYYLLSNSNCYFVATTTHLLRMGTDTAAEAIDDFKYTTKIWEYQKEYTLFDNALYRLESPDKIFAKAIAVAPTLDAFHTNYPELFI